MRDPWQRPGYTELAAVRMLGRDHPEWLSLTDKTLGLPEWMLPAVFKVVHYGTWRRANDPIVAVREFAIRMAGRMGLSEPKPARTDRSLADKLNISQLPMYRLAPTPAFFPPPKPRTVVCRFCAQPFVTTARGARTCPADECQRKTELKQRNAAIERGKLRRPPGRAK